MKAVMHLSKLTLLLSGLLLCVLLQGQGADSARVISLSPSKFRVTMLGLHNYRLADVRETFEFRKSRIKGAINIPASGSLKVSADTMKKNIPLFLYCTTGFRSKLAARYFVKEGFTNVYSLDGGINAWKKEGLEIDKKKRKK
jgi:rhodanese-related sulfurtransferase